MIQYDAGDFLDSENAYTEALKIDKEYEVAFFGLGTLHIACENWQKAVEAFY